MANETFDLFSKPWGIAAVIGGAVLLLIVVIAALIAASGRKDPAGDEGQQEKAEAADMKALPWPPPSDGTEKLSAPVAMEIEVYTGTRKDKGKLQLADRLTIGSGEDCDIRFAPEDMDALAARLVLTDGRICLVGQEERIPVAVGGVRIEGQSPIRSGDVLSVGEAEFMLRFPV